VRYGKVADCSVQKEAFRAGLASMGGVNGAQEAKGVFAEASAMVTTCLAVGGCSLE
jgi:hypothetical protein